MPFFNGIFSIKLLPLFFSDCTLRVASITFAKLYARAKPTPLPFILLLLLSFPRWKGVKILSNFSLGMPGPVSVTKRFTN